MEPETHLPLRFAHCRARLPRLLAGVLVAIALPLAAFAQNATGLITGRVFNPATREYIRNAEVHVEGTALSAVSEEGGYYRLTNVPAGAATVVATYTGHQTARASVNVSAGTTTTQDFELAPTSDAPRKNDEVLTLSAFVVETEREGQAKAISEQKTAMNVKTVVASDNFGDIAEGNIGEFLKFMPGITLDYVETDTRAARMGGMEARYGYVTLDGGTIANTSTGSFGNDSRQFEFEAVSINNIESIEVNRTLSADMPADAPGGTVNLRTKSALDRKGQRFNYTVGVIGNQYEHSLSSTARHDDTKHAKTRPTASFDYSNSYFNNKLGVAINGAFTNVFKEQFRHSLTYDYTSATALARGTPLITAINFKDGPKMTEKSSGGLKLDYQPFRSLRLSLASSYTYFSDEIANRNLNFRVNAANIDPASTMTKVIALPSGANANTRLEHTGSHGNKKTDTTNLSLGYTYKEGRFSSDGSMSYSRARQQNGSLHMAAVEQANLQLTRIGWTAERPSADSPSWYFTQTSGPDWYDLNNYGRSDAQPNNITNSRARAKTEQYVGRLNFKYNMRWELPTFFQSGLYDQVTTRRRETIYQNTLTYVGATGNQLTSPMPVSIADFRIAQPWGSNIGALPVPDKSALFALQTSHPEYFTNTLSNQVSNLETILSSPQRNQEDIKAAYVQGNTRVKKWTFQAGVRWEKTNTLSTVPSIVPIARNPFALVNPTTGARTAATTLDYVNYKYSKGLQTTYGNYDDWLPSASAKYPITQDLTLKLGYNKAIKRPNLNNIAGAWSINSADTVITIPNPDLRPERSDKASAVLEYYFEPAGVVSVHVFQTDLKGATDTTDPLPASAVGLGDDPVYGAYEFVTFENVPGRRRTRGMELSYSQQLTFLPEVLRGTRVFATYARFTAHSRPNNFVPQNATGGISYRYRKFNASIAGTWTDEIRTGSNTVSANSPYTPGAPEYLKNRYVFDVGAGYKLGRNTELFVSGRNAFNSGKTWFYKLDGRIRQMERYGGQWTVGIRGNF
jgi:TonB-dependent receptor